MTCQSSLNSERRRKSLGFSGGGKEFHKSLVRQLLYSTVVLQQKFIKINIQEAASVPRKESFQWYKYAKISQIGRLSLDIKQTTNFAVQWSESPMDKLIVGPKT